MPRKILALGASVAFGLGIAALSVTAVAQSIALQQQGSVISTLSANNDALREQVLEQGEEPVAPPADDVVEDSGEQGPAGLDGTDGVSVLSVSCQANGSWAVLYSNGRVQTDVGPCVAKNGIDGQTGATGPAGADSTVPGPAGAAGSDGEPPVSWTFEWAAFTYLCTRTDPFDASAPTYECNEI